MSPDPDRHPHPLDHPVWSSLTGPHARFAEGSAGALRYRPDVAPWGALGPDLDIAAWGDLAKLTGPAALTLFAGDDSALLERLPADWEVVSHTPGVQMIATDALVSRSDPEAMVLGTADLDDMLDLIRRTEPGPFLPGTPQLGTYLGVRREGRLVALAGERMHPPGWTEISAVCTDPDFRGQGLAGLLIQALAQHIRERGETPFLHAAVTNVSAIRVYERLGFTLRRRVEFVLLRTPAA